MSGKKTGGPAFPTVNYDHGGEDMAGGNGMTLRDHFASKALPTFLAEAIREGAVIGFGSGWIDCVARDAYAMADAMLKARDQ